MSALKDLLLDELSQGGPGKIWYETIHKELKIIAGKWPPKDFVDFEPDANNPTHWRYSDKLDLTQKFFEDEILNPSRGAITFILTAGTDTNIRGNIRQVVNQFLSEITKGADDKRVFNLIFERLSKMGFPLIPPTGVGSVVPTIQSNHNNAARISRLLMLAKDRLPNAFIPAGEGERNSPIWTPRGYDQIAAEITALPEPVTEEALRSGISDALTHLRFALYYADDIPDGVVDKSKNVFRGEDGEVEMVSTLENLTPMESMLASEEFAQAKTILDELSSESRKFLKAMSQSSNKTEIAENLDVSRVTALKMEKQMVIEVNNLFDVYQIPDFERQSVRTALRIVLDNEL